MRIRRVACTAVLVVSLAGCAAPSARQYYTLMPEAYPNGVSAGAGAPARQVPVVARPYAINVRPVSLPEQVDRPQIVISSPGSSQVIPLNDSLWASPLSDEIRNALANDLARQLGVLDISARGAPEGLPLWKISLTVQRFDSVFNERVVLDGTWRLAPVNQPDQSIRICRAEVSIAAEPGVSGLVSGHQRALRQLASVIASQISGNAYAVEKSALTMKGCTT